MLKNFPNSVNDTFENSDPRTTQVQVVTVVTAAVQETKATDTVVTLDASGLKNRNMRNVLINKL